MKYLEQLSDYEVKKFDKWLEHDSNHPDHVIHLGDENFKTEHLAAWNYAMDMTIKETHQAVEGMYHNLK